jgi:hypothetical protein
MLLIFKEVKYLENWNAYLQNKDNLQPNAQVLQAKYFKFIDQ